MGLKLSRTRKGSARKSVALTSVFSLLFLYGQFLLAGPAAAAPFSGGVSPTIYGGKADLNGDGVVNGKDDANKFYGNTHIIDGKLDCNAWGATVNSGAAGSGVIDTNDDCTLLGYDGSSDGVTITVSNGFFALADGNPIPDGTPLPTVFPKTTEPSNNDVEASKFAWSTINGRVDSNGDEEITGEDCTFGLIGDNDDVGIDGVGGQSDGADVLGNDASCGFLVTPAAADNGKVDLDSSGTITAADSCSNGCFFGHNVEQGLVQGAAAPPPTGPFTGGFSPTIFVGKADLNGDGVVNGKDDANRFYGDTHIIDGKLDCDAWNVNTGANDGTAGDGVITPTDDCTLIGYDGSFDGVTITVENGFFILADGAPIPDGTPLPTVFNATDPSNNDVEASDFAWSTINGRVDTNGDEKIDGEDCSNNLIGRNDDVGIDGPGGQEDGIDVLGTECEFAITPPAADFGKVDLNESGTITAADSCSDGCFFGHDVSSGIVQVVDAALSINDVTVSEGAGTATFTVTLSEARDQIVTVDYETVNGTATAGSDYTFTTGTVTFAPGDTSETIGVPILNDSVSEPTENFFVDIFDASGANISDSQGQGTITDNDAVTISINDVTVGEAAGPATFTVSLSNASSQTVTVNFATANNTATAGSDYTATTGTVTFVPGDTSETVSVTILNDTADEPDETFFVNLSNATNATISDAQGVGTIQDNDPTAVPSISINDVTVGEGDGTATFTVSLSESTSSTVTVTFTTANNTATAGSDYTATSGTLTFAPGDTSETVSVTILQDSLDEASETFFVNLSGATNATIADGQGQGTITDDDSGPTISIDDVTVDEGDGTATFTVTKSGSTAQTVTVDFATANGTATAGSDYTSTSGTLTFAPGDTSETVSVAILEDTLDEADETFFVNLSNATNATIADGQGLGTIQDNDPPPVAPGSRPAIVRDGVWFLRNTLTTGVADTVFAYGNAPDLPVFGDWDGNGSSTPGVFRSGVWYLDNGYGDGADIIINYGDASFSLPVVGDWNNDGIDTVGLVRDGVWFLRNTNTTGQADSAFAYGNPTGDAPIVGDWDGDGDDTVGIVRNGVWFQNNQNDSSAPENVFGFGNGTDGPLVGDWNADGTDTPGVFRDGVWYTRNSNTGGIADGPVFGYGDGGDRYPRTWNAV